MDGWTTDGRTAGKQCLRPVLQVWARDVKARDRDKTFVALET